MRRIMSVLGFILPPVIAIAAGVLLASMQSASGASHGAQDRMIAPGASGWVCTASGAGHMAHCTAKPSQGG